MRVSAAELESYSAQVAAQQRAARAYVETSLRAYLALNPDPSVADVREHGMQVLAQAYRVYGDRAAYVACQWYDEAMARLGHDLDAAELFNDVDADAIGRGVRYLVGLVADGDPSGYVSRMADKAYDHAMRAANSTMYGNANRPADARAGVRYARVPTGSETCGFCLMLASLGFNYRSRETAGDVGAQFNSYHDHCDCRVVVGDDLTTVEGYDPDWYYEVYQDARAAVADGCHDEWESLGGKDGTGKTYDKYLRDRICAEIESRDREWVWHRPGE